MRSTFFGLEMGRRALQAQQRALDVTGHNISNANTQGYSRQEAVLKATNPYTVPGFNKPSGPGQIGSGVDVKEIRRIRDQFIDTQVRTENKSLGYWDVKKDALQKIEVIVNEPSDSGLRSVTDKFWESWQELSKNPESVAVRSVVRQRGIAVAETFNHLDRLYRDLQYDLNETIKVKVNDVNSIARQIADINTQVLSIEGTGDKANDLRDKRDLLIDQLSKIADTTTYENNLGVVNVKIGGTDLVVNARVSELTVAQGAGTGFNNVIWADTLIPTSLNSGELKGLLESRGYTDPATGKFGGIIPDLRNDLDIMAKTMVEQINKIHRGGYDLNGNQDNNFFKPYVDGVYPPNGVSYASTMTLDNGIVASLNAIAAGNEPPVAGVAVIGNGENALDIAQIKQSILMDLTKGQNNLFSIAKSSNNYATRADGITNSPYLAPLSGQTFIGVGGVFNLTDFSPNASLDIKQGANSFTINITDGAGLLVAGLPADMDALVTRINTDALANGMNLTASIVADPSGGFKLQILSTQSGPGNEITVQENNFKGAATLGLVNPNVTGTIDDFYRSQIGKLGVASQEADRMVDNQSLLVEQLDQRRQAMSGVSLDEEMTNMLKFQHAYNAAAKVLNAFDEMLETIINRLGAGR
jgi:flagellar hook-associated protein 1